MIIVDSSVWIDHLRGLPTAHREKFLGFAHSADTDIGVGDIVRYEVLSGARSERELESARFVLDAFIDVPMVGRKQAELAAAHYRSLRRAGLTVQTVDLLIATSCVSIGARLLSKDAIFIRIALHIGLNLVDPHEPAFED